VLKERFCAKRRANRSLVSWGHYGVIVYKVSVAIQTEQHLAQWSVADVQLSLASGGPWCRPPAPIAQWHPLFSRLTACWIQWLRLHGGWPRIASHPLPLAHQRFNNPTAPPLCRQQRCLMCSTESRASSLIARLPTAYPADIHCLLMRAGY